MHGSDDLPVALARLVALGQSPDVNIRPVLLRVVVDLFVNKPHHAPDDIRQFETIVSHLLDHAELDTRVIVAAKLSGHPLTPRALIERFRADDPAVALNAYAAAPLDGSTLLAGATWGNAELATAIAGRPDLTSELVAALAARPEDEVVHALAANLAITLERTTFQKLVRRARQDDRLASFLIERSADPIDYAPLFPLARTQQRQAVIEAARRLEMGKRQWGRLDGATAATLARLDRMVLSGERENFESALGLTLGIDPATMSALLQDDGGEIMALALAAAGASEDLAARTFILGDPRIGHSVERVRALTQIVATVSAQAARRLIGAMTAAPAETTIRRSQKAKAASAAASRRADLPVDMQPARRETPVLPVLPARRLG